MQKKTSHSLSLPRLITLIFGSLTLSACGGGSGSGGGGETINLAEYVIPTSTASIDFEEYSWEDEDLWGPYHFSETWTVHGNNTADMDNGDDILYFSYAGNRINVLNDVEDVIYWIPRQVRAGQTVRDSDNDRLVVFGPYESRTFSIPNDGPTRTDEDVIIMIQKISYNSSSDIIINYYAKGLGQIGTLYYEDCSSSIGMTLDTSYASCEYQAGDIRTNEAGPL